jgi:hypothetical protein
MSSNGNAKKMQAILINLIKIKLIKCLDKNKKLNLLDTIAGKSFSRKNFRR